MEAGGIGWADGVGSDLRICWQSGGFSKRHGISPNGGTAIRWIREE